MDAKHASDRPQPLLGFVFNGLVSFGEFAVPFRRLNRISPTGNYHWAVNVLLALAGIVVAVLFVIWLLGRYLWLGMCRLVSLQPGRRTT